MENSSFLDKVRFDMQVGILHPGTKLLIALCFIVLVFGLPIDYQAIAIFLGWIIAWGLVKAIPYRDPGHIFLRLWLTAGFFLIIIHSVSFNGGFVFNQDGLQVAGRSFFRIGSLMVAFLWVIRTTKAEELYAMLLDLRLPVSVIYVLFQAIYLIPRFGDRAREILIAQQARGFVLKGIRNRLRALILIFAPLFSTAIYELEENAASISARGLHAPGRKTHLCKITFTALDAMLFVAFIVVTSVFLAMVN